jgi:triacylglycerol lipase
MEQFQPDAVGYSLANAQALVRAARLSYQSPQEITKQVWSWGFPQFKFFDCETTQAYVMANDRAIVIAFRGTEMKKMQDWMTDLKANLTPECGGKAHRGFKTAIDHVWEPLLVTVLQFRTQGQRVFLTGHSLGGALATVASLRLMKAGQIVAGVYTYGSPRVGDRAFRTEFNDLLLDRTFRFINDEDAVVRLPMKMLGYCHVGQRFRFDSSGQLERTMPSQYSFLSHAKDELEEYLDPDFEFVKDHDLESYQVMLEGLSRSLQAV